MSDTIFDDEFMATMLGEFLDESQGYLSRLNDNLLILDELVSSLNDGEAAHADLEILNEMFRDAHSLKGLSAMLQFDDINNVTHRIENVFDAARRDNLGITRELTDLMFQAIDFLTQMVDDLKDPDSEAGKIEYQEVLDQLHHIVQRHNEANSPAGSETSTADANASDANASDSEKPADSPADSPASTSMPSPTGQAAPITAEPNDTPDSSPDETLVANLGAMDKEMDSVTDDSDISEKYLGIFIEEAEQSLDELMEALDNGPEPSIDPLLIISHRIKGAAASIGLNRAARLAHTMEDLLQDRPEAGKTISPEIAEGICVAVEAFRTSLDIYRAGSDETDPFDAAYRTLKAIQRGNGLEKNADKANAANHATPTSPSDHSQDANNKPEPEPSSQAIIGEVTETAAVPVVEKATAAAKLANPTAAASTDDKARPNSPAGNPPRQAPAANKDKPTETLRVDIERLDHLMNLSGQLVINKAQFAQITKKLKGLSSRKQSIHRLNNAHSVLDRILAETHSTRGVSANSADAQQLRNHIQLVKDDLAIIDQDIEQLRQARSTINDLNEAVHLLDRVADGIQKSVMDTRMVPVGPLFTRFKRVVRDITRVNGKDVQLLIHGEKTELDKRMIDELADPLIHMVRNSADHGIELPEERIAAGKPARGTIKLDAFHRGNRVIVQVRDDGKGLDPEKIRAKAVAKNIISAQDAERLTDQQSLQLIWEPGFSTAEQITEVSGRGMGMDIVRSKIEQLNGTVELESDTGVGTTITIQLPLTVAILPSLLTVIGKNVFAIPLESVKEIVRVNNREVNTVRGINTADVRGRVISLVELSDLFQWKTPPKSGSQQNGEHTLVIVGSDGDELGLAVDHLLGEEDIVIKSLAENYRNVDGLSGASILGDGRVSLILDVSALVSMACRQPTSAESESRSYDSVALKQ